jgi:hypothetical protein
VLWCISKIFEDIFSRCFAKKFLNTFPLNVQRSLCCLQIVISLWKSKFWSFLQILPPNALPRENFENDIYVIHNRLHVKLQHFPLSWGWKISSISWPPQSPDFTTWPPQPPDFTTWPPLSRNFTTWPLQSPDFTTWPPQPPDFTTSPPQSPDFTTCHPDSPNYTSCMLFDGPRTLPCWHSVKTVLNSMIPDRVAILDFINQTVMKPRVVVILILTNTKCLKIFWDSYNIFC